MVLGLDLFSPATINILNSRVIRFACKIILCILAI